MDASSRSELEQLRRSIAMLSQGQMALTREQALNVIERLQRSDTSTRQIVAELREMLDRLEDNAQR